MYPLGSQTHLVIVLLCVLVELVQCHQGVQGVCVCLEDNNVTSVEEQRLDAWLHAGSTARASRRGWTGL